MKVRHLLLETFAHMPPEPMLADLGENQAFRKPPHAPHSVAELVAHMSFWQEWFLARCRGKAIPMAASAKLGWPVVASGGWARLSERFLSGLEEAATFDPKLFGRPLDPPIEFPPLAEYTVEDALVHIATHNAHHLGQVVLVRQMLGLWPPPSGSWTW